MVRELGNDNLEVNNWLERWGNGAPELQAHVGEPLRSLGALIETPE